VDGADESSRGPLITKWFLHGHPEPRRRRGTSQFQPVGHANWL